MLKLVCAAGPVGCLIVAPAPGVAVDAEFIAAHVPEGVSSVVVEHDDLPAAPPESWKIVGGAIVVDSTAADVEARKVADVERVLRVADAYGGAEKRTSLYGYLGELNAYKIDDTATEGQIADRSLLLDAAKWEQDMLDAVALVTASTPPVWPSAPAGLASLAAAS